MFSHFSFSKIGMAASYSQTLTCAPLFGTAISVSVGDTINLTTSCTNYYERYISNASLISISPAFTSFGTVTAQSAYTISAVSTGSTIIFFKHKFIGTSDSSGNSWIQITISAATLAASATTTSQSLTVGTAMTSFTPLTGSGGTSPLTYYVSSGTLPTGLSLSSSTGVVSGTPTASYSAADVVFAVKDANNSVASTTSTVSFTVAAALISTTTTLTTSSNSPLSGQSVTFTATVSPSAATGTVTFKDSGTTLGTSNLSSGVATYSTSSLSTASHSITATYNSDTTYAASSSGTETVTPYTRSNPASDANVKGIIRAQFSTPLRVAKTHIGSIENRLEALHGDNPNGFQNGFRVTALTGVGNSKLNSFSTDFDEPSEHENVFQKYDEYDDRNNQFPDKQKTEFKGSQNTTLKILPDVNIWTAGLLILGSEKNSSQSLYSKVRISGLSAGFDTKISENIKTGLAIGFSTDITEINSDGSKNAGRTWMVTSYTSFNPVKNVYIDGFIGTGSLLFNINRYDTNSTSFMTGKRAGWILFGGLVASVEQRLQNFKFAPYTALNFTNVNLNEFSENGSSIWTLNYQSTYFSTQNLTIGIRGAYDFNTSWGSIVPTFRIGMQTSFNTEATQIISYTDDQTTEYTLTETHIPERIYSGGIGLLVNTNRARNSRFDYIYSSSGADYNSSRFQFSYNMPL